MLIYGIIILSFAAFDANCKYLKYYIIQKILEQFAYYLCQVKVSIVILAKEDLKHVVQLLLMQACGFIAEAKMHNATSLQNIIKVYIS